MARFPSSQVCVSPELSDLVMSLNPPHFTQHTNNETHTMSKQVLISMLRQGNTGNEILSILDVIANDAISEGDDDTQTGNVPTLEYIDF